MGRVSGEPHVRRHVRRDAVYAASDGRKPRRYVCPRCGAEVVVYVEATEAWCSCGTRMRPDGEPPPAKRKRSEEALEVAPGAR